MEEELPPGAEKRIERARAEPRLRPTASIGHCFTEATLAQLQIGGDGLLSDPDVALFRSIIRPLGRAIAFDDDEIGSVDPRIVPPMVIFTTAHVPWKPKLLPIPRAHYDKLLELLRARITWRVFEPAQGPYANRWFTVPKKDRNLQIIQDLRPVNAVMIRNSGVAPILDDYAELFAARAIYSMADLFSSYDQFQLELASRELTAMQTPLGLL
ncbi:MAG: hypothetical protein BJ554DRAFT_3250, partial [Olpidium bornovanus]